MSEDSKSSDTEQRRTFIATLAMLCGLAGGYGAFAAVTVRYLFPAKRPDREWFYVARTSEIEVGGSKLFKTPSGATVTIVRRDASEDPTGFVALSSTCPHLGCKVHWEGHNSRFFCPCHNGVFSPDGTATEGPPAEAGQSLPKYPLKVAEGLLFIEVEQLSRAV